MRYCDLRVGDCVDEDGHECHSKHSHQDARRGKERRAEDVERILKACVIHFWIFWDWNYGFVDEDSIVSEF